MKYDEYLENIRKKLRKKLTKTNYKSLAALIGIRESVLIKFINGSTPQGVTQDKILEYLEGKC
jgi:hypothetical protein